MKKNKVLTITLLLVLIFNVLIVFNVSAEVGDVLLDDFDDYNIGDTSGTNGDFSWERKSGTFVIDGSGDPTGDKYLIVDEDAYGWFNVTSGSHRGYYVTHNDGGCGFNTDENFYYFYNTTGDLVVKLRFGVSNTNPDRIRACYYNEEGMNSLTCELSDDNPYTLSWLYYTENVIQYTLYDKDDNIVVRVNDTALITGTDYTSSSQFNVSDCKVVGSSYANSITIGEYGYNDNEIYGDTTYPDLDGFVLSVNGQTGTPDLCIGETARFEYELIGDDGKACSINITDPNGDYWFYASTDPSQITSTGQFYKTPSLIGTYTIEVVDRYHPDTTVFTGSFDVIDCNMITFEERFGNFYAEFYDTGADCYYENEDHPEICYQLMDHTNYSTVDNRYYIDIYSIDWQKEERVGSFIASNNSLEWRKSMDGIFLDYLHEYEIRVYNVTKSGLHYIRDELVYTSVAIDVCSPSTVDEQGDDEFVDDDSSDDGTDYFDDTGTSDYKAAIGIGVVVTIAGILGYIGGALLGGFGFIGSMLFLSVPDTAFQLFPVITLFIMGFICILLFLMLFVQR